MPPEGIDSLDAKSLKGLVLSLLARIDVLVARVDELLEQNNTLQARIAELEGRGGKPPKTPTFYMVVSVREHLTPARHLSTAGAALGKDVARHVGVRTELARDAGVAFAALLLGRRLRNVGLLPA
jgi:hypothetical protein